MTQGQLVLVKGTGAVGAATLGWIVTIEGTICRSAADPPYGHRVFIDASTDIDATKLQAGRTIRVTGFGSQYETTYEVEPRSRADIRERP